MSVIPQKLDLNDMYMRNCKKWINEAKLYRASIRQDNAYMQGNVAYALQNLQALKNYQLKNCHNRLCPEYQKTLDEASTIEETIQKQL